MILLRRQSKLGLIGALVGLFYLLSVVLYSRKREAALRAISGLELDWDFQSARTFFNKLVAKPNIDAMLQAELGNVDLTNKDKFWKFSTDLTDTEVRLHPLEFVEMTESEFYFDPRVTYTVYLRYLRNQLALGHENITVPFAWSDWVDLTKLNRFVLLSEEEKPGCEGVMSAPKAPVPKKKVNPKSKRDPALDRKSFAGFCYKNEDVIKGVGNDDQKPPSHLLPGFNVFANPAKNTDDVKALQAKSYLNVYAPQPVSIVFNTREGNYEVGTSHKARFVTDFELWNPFNVDNETSFNAEKELYKLQDEFPLDQKSQMEQLVAFPLTPSMFEYRWEDILKEYERKSLGQSLSLKEQNHFNSLKYSSSLEDASLPKYFSEVGASNQRKYGEVGSHYDWRFFNGFVTAQNMNKFDDPEERKRIKLHKILRAWLQFTRTSGIVTWVAHGSLLGWYWDGLSFPWDSDIDVQMPIMSLDHLARNYNQSLIVSDLTEGYGKYFIDVGSSITHRTKGNGKNNIDARFIDVDSGLYIDITGMALSNTPMPPRYSGSVSKRQKLTLKPSAQNELAQVYNCRNKHFVSFSEISPLRVTMVEGEIAMIPNNYETCLKNEYSRGLSTETFNGYVYIQPLRIWLPFYRVYNALNPGSDRLPAKKKVPLARAKSFIKRHATGENIVKLLEDEEVLREFFLTHKVTQLHQREMELLKLQDSEYEEYVRMYKPQKPLRKDYLQFEKEVVLRGEDVI